MPVLRNARWEAFAQAVAKGSSATEAYAAAGYKPHQPSASRLLSNAMVYARIAEIVGKAAEKAEVTAKEVILGLFKEATREGEGASHSARVSAWVALGKYHNLFTDRVEATVSGNVTVTDARSALESLIDRQLSARPDQGGAGKPH